jgi:hypothetical protein
MPVFRNLLNRTVTVRIPSASRAVTAYVTLDDYQEPSWSPIPAAIQPAASASLEDRFFEHRPDATHSLWCARDVRLEVGYLLSWVEHGGSEAFAFVVGPPEDEGGRAHHWRVPLRQVDAIAEAP